MIVRADHTAEKPVLRDTLAKGAGRILAEYAGGAEVRPWVEGHSDPRVKERVAWNALIKPPRLSSFTARCPNEWLLARHGISSVSAG